MTFHETHAACCASRSVRFGRLCGVMASQMTLIVASQGGAVFVLPDIPPAGPPRWADKSALSGLPHPAVEHSGPLHTVEVSYSQTANTIQHMFLEQSDRV